MFYDILEEKNAFLGCKNKELKQAKNWDFPKGLVHRFGPKLPIFPSVYFLGNIGQDNVFYDILEGKSAFLCYKNKEVKKSKNWFWSKVGHFSIVFFLGNLGQENVFDDILQRKSAILGYKNKKLKKSKNWVFSKGVSPWFWSIIGHFCFVFFLRQSRPENVFYDILEKKYAFLCSENKELEQAKNFDFSKGVCTRIWSKIGHFSILFCLGYLGQENVFYDILEQ